jgi:hypothetical protein
MYMGKFEAKQQPIGKILHNAISTSRVGEKYSN